MKQYVFRNQTVETLINEYKIRSINNFYHINNWIKYLS